MAGKSTFIRSVGIACLLAQIGSFVPAEEAVMTVIDRICARYFRTEPPDQLADVLLVQ